MHNFPKKFSVKEIVPFCCFFLICGRVTREGRLGLLLGRLDHFTKLDLRWGGRIENNDDDEKFCALAALYLLNGLTEWVIIQDNTIQSDRRGNACTTGQMYTQLKASWKLYEIRPPLTCLCKTSNFQTKNTTRWWASEQKVECMDG